MSYLIVLTPTAKQNLRTIHAYIFKQAPRSADYWLDRAEQAVDSLDHHPERCPLAPESLSFGQTHPSVAFWRGKSGHILPLVRSGGAVGLRAPHPPWFNAAAIPFGKVNSFQRVHHSGMFPCFFGGFLSRLVTPVVVAPDRREFSSIALNGTAEADTLIRIARTFARFPRGEIRRARAPALHNPHSGMFPCFFGGFLSRLVSSISSAWISFLRLSRAG